MPDEFHYDVFLNHSAKDKAVVRAVAERLRADGLRVWFNEWVLKSGDSIPAKIEERLAHGTFLIRDPSESGWRFVSLLLADCNAVMMSVRRWRKQVLGQGVV